MLTLATVALAADLSVGATGGIHRPTAQAWSGVEGAIHPSQRKGIGGFGRVSAGWGFGDATPMLGLEAGATVVIPNDEAVVRFGLGGFVDTMRVTYALPVMLGGDLGEPHFGLIPGGFAQIEFAWPHDPEAESLPFAFGGRLGFGSTISDIACDEDSDPDQCLVFTGGLDASMYGRTRIAQHLHLELRVGTTMRLTVGYAF